MDAGEILLVLAAVAFGFFAKGVTGLGGPPLAIPVLATFMGVEYAVAVIAIPAALANGVQSPACCGKIAHHTHPPSDQRGPGRGSHTVANPSEA